MNRFPGNSVHSLLKIKKKTNPKLEHELDSWSTVINHEVFNSTLSKPDFNPSKFSSNI